MKRYVKEFYNDLLKELEKISNEKEKKLTHDQMDRILQLYSRGYLTSREAVNALMTEYDKLYYSLF